MGTLRILTFAFLFLTIGCGNTQSNKFRATVAANQIVTNYEREMRFTLPYEERQLLVRTAYDQILLELERKE